MDRLDDVFAVLDASFEAESKTKTTKKRKWREIEALKEKHRLRKELKAIDWSLDDDAISMMDV